MVLAVWGCPQSGKTTLAVNLSVAAAKKGKQVCIISAEDYAELPAFFGKSNSNATALINLLKTKSYITDALEVMKNIRIIAPETHGDSFTEVLTATQAREMIEDCAALFDLTIIDCTSHKAAAFTGEGLAIADKILVSLGGRTVATTWVSSNRRLFTPLKNKIVYALSHTTKYFNYAVMMSVLEDIDYDIPYCKDMDLYNNDGTPFYNENSARHAYCKAIDNILGREVVE